MVLDGDRIRSRMNGSSSGKERRMRFYIFNVSKKRAQGEQTVCFVHKVQYFLAAHEAAIDTDIEGVIFTNDGFAQ